MALNVGALASLVVGAEVLITAPAIAAVRLAAAALGLTILVRREKRSETPLIPLDLLRANSFRTSVIASMCCFAGVTMGLLALPFHLQHGLGRDTLTTGLYMTAWPLTVAIVAPLAGRLANRVATGRVCAAGGVGLAVAALWPLEGDPLPRVALTMLCGLGSASFRFRTTATCSFRQRPREAAQQGACRPAPDWRARPQVASP